jgi:hypothetical protein
LLHNDVPQVIWKKRPRKLIDHPSAWLCLSTYGKLDEGDSGWDIMNSSDIVIFICLDQWRCT